MRKINRTAPIVVILSCLIIAPVSAIPVSWNLNNVVFDDAGTATGSFVYDVDADVVSFWSISVADGNTANFSEFTYSNLLAGQDEIHPLQGSGQAFIFRGSSIPDDGNRRHLRLFALTPLTNAGGMIVLGPFSVGNSFNLECFNCAPVREINAGANLTGIAIPEPATLAVFALGLAGLGFMRRKRRWAM